MQSSPELRLSPSDFRVIRDLLHRCCGIWMGESKHQLVQSRLAGRIRELGVLSFADYVHRLGQRPDDPERAFLVDALTTNKTSFFREASHFSYLIEALSSRQTRPESLRIWSAGCSSGEEPYSLLMALEEGLDRSLNVDIQLLATDICQPVLTAARAGIYEEEDVRQIPPPLRAKYMTRSANGRYQVNSQLSSRISFARLNLVDPWPMKGPFDAVFCRNVLMYFDDETIAKLAERFRRILRPGGLLFIGQTESLGGSPRGFRLVKPAMYVRTELPGDPAP